MSASVRLGAGAGNPAPADAVSSIVKIPNTRASGAVRWLARGIVAAMLAASLPAAASAAGLPKPSPFAETLPARAGECIEVEQMKIQLGRVIAATGGRGLMFLHGVQQRFADEWRRELALDPVTISVTLVWLREAAMIAEFDTDGCLLTMTRMSLDEFVRLVHAGAGESARPMGTPGLPSEGRFASL